MEAKAAFIADSRNSFQLSREFCQTLIFKSIFFRTPAAGRAAAAASADSAAPRRTRKEKVRASRRLQLFRQAVRGEFLRRIRIGNRALGHNPGKTLDWNGTNGTAGEKAEKKRGLVYTRDF